MKSVNIFLVNRNDMTTAGNNDENAENAENVANVEVVEFVTDVVENAAIAESPAKKMKLVIIILGVLREFLNHLL